jgi:hypothetical protein
MKRPKRKPRKPTRKREHFKFNIPPRTRVVEWRIYSFLDRDLSEWCRGR